MKRVCVFCGSKRGDKPTYMDAAGRLGERLVERGLTLVYGGGSVGLMGALADTVLAASGTVIGVIPAPLATRELAHDGLNEMVVVDSMHDRKAKMAELADGFISLPGGYGTLEETLEMITWAQLGIHEKPVGLLNVEGFFDPLARLFDHAVEEGFLKAEHRSLFILEETSMQLLDRMTAYVAPKTRSWLTPEQT